MIYKCLIPVLLFIAAVNVSGQSWKVIPAASKISFSIKNAGLTVKGTFNEFTSVIFIDPGNLENSKIESKIFIKSIDTGIKLRDNHLKAEGYFHEKDFPFITFASKKINATSEINKFIVTGLLEIKGHSKEISFPVTMVEKGTETIFDSSFSIHRLDYKVGQSSWTMGDEVQIRLVIHTSKN